MKDKVSEIIVSYNEKVPENLRCKINSSKDAADLLYKHWDKNTIEMHETFKLLLLNNGNQVKGIYQVSTGGITGTLVDLRLLFAVVLKSLSVGIIMTHNHPCGTLKPSIADETLTKKIKKASELFDIRLLDHIIITPNGDYFSFADNGLIF